MKVASLLGKLRYDEVQPLDSWEVLRMGTITGARAIGLDHEIGSIEPGKRADIIGVRTDTPRMTPFFAEGPYFNLHHNLVHAVRGGDVSLAMVDGRVLVEDGALKTADLEAIIAEVHAVAPGLFERRAAFLAGEGGNMVQWTTS
jgi:5-methylthioadenosine/S-adenosylhomocysteine deaminase